MSDIPLPQIPAQDNTFGAILIGVVIATALWGVTAVQSYEYYADYPEDRSFLKYLVGIVFILDTLHHSFMCHATYIYVIKGITNPPLLLQITWTLDAQAIISAFLGVIVQAFFVWRVWILSCHNIFVCIGIGIQVAAVFALTIVYWAKGMTVDVFLKLPSLLPLGRALNALICGADVSISAAITYYLYTGRTGVKSTDKIIKRLMVFSVSSGIWNSLCTMSSLVSLIAWPDTLIFIAFYVILARLYSNSLLTTLNARLRLREKSQLRITASISEGLATLSPTIPRHLEIQVDCESHVEIDHSRKTENCFRLNTFPDSQKWPSNGR